jgi:hypothetical protein
MTFSVVDYVVWCSVATVKAVIAINPSDVPVNFSHFMPNICSPVVREKRLIIKLLSPSVFEMLDSVAFFLFCSYPFPSLHSSPHNISCLWHQAISDAIGSKVKYFFHLQFMGV